jgi:alpha-glucosidase (family GH31 glycosyl hydrolase)
VFWNNTSASRFNNRFVHYLYVSSDVADVIDYYFLYGPEFDRIIAAYRELTGAAPMYGRCCIWEWSVSPAQMCCALWARRSPDKATRPLVLSCR